VKPNLFEPNLSTKCSEIFFTATLLVLSLRVARWYIFKPKIPIGVNFRRPRNWLVCTVAIWNILRAFGAFYDYSVSQWHFGIFPPFWNFKSRKIWQTCLCKFAIKILKGHFKGRLTFGHVVNKLSETDTWEQEFELKSLLSKLYFLLEAPIL
jgi:hypothetical protein